MQQWFCVIFDRRTGFKSEYSPPTTNTPQRPTTKLTTKPFLALTRTLEQERYLWRKFRRKKEPRKNTKLQKEQRKKRDRLRQLDESRTKASFEISARQPQSKIIFYCGAYSSLLKTPFNVLDA